MISRALPGCRALRASAQGSGASTDASNRRNGARRRPAEPQLRARSTASSQVQPGSAAPQGRALDRFLASPQLRTPPESGKPDVLPPRVPLALGAGGSAGALYGSLFDVYAHEYLGHCVLGGLMVRDYAPGQGPYFAAELGGGGVAHVRHGDPNALGEAMGRDGLSAFTSVTGSVPGLLLNTISVIAGMQTRHEHPAAGYALLGFGLANHAVNSHYPCTAAVMSAAEIDARAAEGHDFANFAQEMSLITGAPAHAIAVMTAAAWLGIVPSVAVAMYLLERSNKLAIVPDQIALHHWLSRAEADPAVSEVFERILASYRGRDRLRAAAQHFLTTLDQCACRQAAEGPGQHPSQFARTVAGEHPELASARWALQRELCDFDAELMRRIPARALNGAKRDLLRKWSKLQDSGRLQRWTTGLGIATLCTATTIGLLSMLSATVSALQPVAAALSYAFPALQAVVVGLSAWETYRDLKSPEASVPRRAKRLSIARTAAVTVTAGLLIASVLAPGANLVMIPLVALAIGTSLALGYWKNRALRKCYEAHLAARPEQVGYMGPCIQAYERARQAILREGPPAGAPWPARLRCARRQRRQLQEVDGRYAHAVQWGQRVEHGIRYGQYTREERKRLPAAVGCPPHPEPPRGSAPLAVAKPAESAYRLSC